MKHDRELMVPAVKATLSPKLYRVEVHGGGDLDNSPRVAIFDVNERSARDIVKLSLLVKANDVYKIERFDCRAEFLQYDPETDLKDAEDAGDENSVRTECDVLVVTDTEFSFQAYVKHTDVSVACEAQSIAELASHFGISFGELLPVTDPAGAKLFFSELLDSVETLSGIADQYGSSTLADLMYLQNAIANGSGIEHCVGESAVTEVVKQLPSADRWLKYVDVQN